MDYVKIYDYEALLEQHPQVISANICDFIQHCKEVKKIAPATIHTYVSAIKHFYSFNDILSINWKKIRSFEPEHESVAEDSPYTHEEIHKLLEKGNERDRAMILLMCSSGIRVGALAGLRLKDLEALDNHQDKYSIYKIRVYKKSGKAKYFTFCTPEARKEIDSYLQLRKRMGEHLKPDAPLFRKKYDIELQVQNPHPLKTAAIRHIVRVLLHKSGVRMPQFSTETKRRSTRTDRMECHGFRKFFETTAFKAGMDEMYIRRLMGQKTGLEESYLKLSEQDLLEGNDRHAGYLDIIDALTINEENKLRRQVEMLTVEKTQMDQLRAEIDNIKALMKQQS